MSDPPGPEFGLPGRSWRRLRLRPRRRPAAPPRRAVAMASPARKIASKLGMEELVRVRLGRVDDALIARL